MKTPVLFLVFNRPELSERVLGSIRQVRPSRLFIAADGPRPELPGDAVLCEETRSRVESGIDWPCEIHRLYRDRNLGCKDAVSSALDWFFSEVEEGIILEDDTLPHESFFHFVNTLLERYRDDHQVMHVSGNNHQHGRIRGNGAYYASRFAHSWGWATWRRSWKHYDIMMRGFPEEWEQIAQACSLPDSMNKWWKLALGNVCSGITNTWDFQWHYAIMKNLGISLIPNKNLVENIGVGTAATHMKKRDVSSSIQASWLSHYDSPTSLEVCKEADAFDFKYSVMNRRVPLKNLSELYRLWKFNQRQKR
jgi:hypothetical protein